MISAATGRVAVRVIRTDEELMIAQSVCSALGLGDSSGGCFRLRVGDDSTRLDSLRVGCSMPQREGLFDEPCIRMDGRRDKDMDSVIGVLLLELLVVAINKMSKK